MSIIQQALRLKIDKTDERHRRWTRARRAR
jgi:hypothetical protein